MSTELTTFESYAKFASFLCSNMETLTSDNGEKSFTRTKVDCPAWVRDLIYTVKADNGEIYDALSAISDARDDDDLEDIAADVVADTYTADLFAWLSADISRYNNVDDAVSETGWNGLIAALEQAQIQYRENLVRELYARLEEEERVKSAEEVYTDAFNEALDALGYTQDDAYNFLPFGYIVDVIADDIDPVEAARSAAKLIKAEQEEGEAK